MGENEFLNQRIVLPDSGAAVTLIEAANEMGWSAVWVERPVPGVGTLIYLVIIDHLPAGHPPTISNVQQVTTGGAGSVGGNAREVVPALVSQALGGEGQPYDDLVVDAVIVS